ncbi:MAG: tyrosine-type recombinase/integrase [Rhodospirillales bacterium]|nr:tyrosine-type recombinase/integrase [Rhodospirillales bacterium]
MDAAIVAVLFQGGLRRSEAAALVWGDIGEARDGVLIRVRCSRTGPDGSGADVRYLKSEFARAVLRLRAETNGARNPEQPVFGGLTGATLAKRLAAAAASAGIEGRITGHSGRVCLAAELTARGAPMQAVMLAGNWKSPAMVAHYSAAAGAEHGAVARYL